MEFRVLGPVVVLDDGGTPLDVGPSQQRAVLALCVLAAPRPVSMARIVDALWEQEPPPGAVNTVQAYVSKLRRVLEPGRVRRARASVLVSRPGGYAIELPPESVDLGRAEAAVAAGRRLLEAGDHAGAAERLRFALAEWRGEPLAGFEDEPWARDEIAHLTELRLSVIEDVAQAELALGAGRALVPELTRLVTAHPLRERLRRLGAHALYQAGRQADALALLAEGRRLLIGELGLDPDPGSRELERRILEQDPSLRPPPAAPRAPETMAPMTVASAAATPVTGAGTDTGGAGRQEGALIGRSAESRVLRRAVAADGTRIVLVAGEPGIGKTSLAEDAAAHAPVAVFGRCWDGTGAPPFWPWAQAARQLTGRHGELAEVLGATGEFALYEAFARLVAEHAAAQGRVLVVLDDLQWADASSLRLLEFLATTRACPGLTVIATYRDTEVGGPLSRTLATLVRLPQVERITLGGLGEDAIAEYLRRSGGDAARAAEVARRTGGNPFFLGELVHLDGGEAPAAVADVLRGRMAAMPPGAPGVLSAAALLGRDAPLDVLLDVVHDVMDVPRDEVLDVLDAAVRARLLTEHDLVYRFAHDIVRDVLRDGLAPLRRRRLHAAIAAVLERRGTHLAELAHHYREGLVISGMAAKAIEYARQAAAHAMAQFAYEDAVEHLRHAVALTGQLPVPAATGSRALRCDLLLGLAEAQSAAGMSTQVHASLEEAAEIADALGDDDRLARAALGFSDPLSWAMYEEWAAGSALTGRIERALRSQEEGSPWRSQLLAAFAITGCFTRPVEESVALAAEAVREARLRGDDGSLLRALSAYEILSRGVAGQAERQAAIDEMAEVARRSGDLVAEWLAREAEHVELVKQGELERAYRLLTWLSDTARRIRQPALLSLSAWLSAIHAYLRGDPGRALEEAEESARLHPEGALGRDHAESRAGVFRCLAARMRGDAAAALTLAEEALARRPGQPGWRVLRCAALLDLGRREEALEVFAGLARDDFAGMRGDFAYRFIPDLLSEACLALRDTAAASALRELLLPHRGRLLGWAVTDLCLARLALARDDRETARRHLRDALALVRRSGATLYEKPILALQTRV
ncbi:BTAD domain-containing putative transcriptional regulator [Microbispora sp. CA-135349]|uniref:BTAD domain-containing putative transcriptional regulator n=1 Tax=Microbispora sp. CA-135349 TaxID=3239953 RepID=UPI003D8F566B